MPDIFESKLFKTHAASCVAKPGFGSMLSKMLSSVATVPTLEPAPALPQEPNAAGPAPSPVAMPLSAAVYGAEVAWSPTSYADNVI